MADTKISLLSSLTKSTVALTDVLPIVDVSASQTKKITVQEILQPQDNIFRLAGSADNTKLVAFEVDGLTTATTRTITVPDADLTLVGTATTQTLTNKTLTSPQINFGSDSRGDLITRDSGGTTVRLPIGTSGQILSVSASGDPEWIANPSAADSSTTVKGVVEIATTAEITAGTATGGTGAVLVVPASAVGTTASKIVQLDSSARLPAVDGSLLINVANPVTYKSGTTTFDSSTTTTTTIAHGLGKTPKFVRIKAIYSTGASSGQVRSEGSYNGTTQVTIYRWFDTNGNTSGVNSVSGKIAHLSYGNGSGDSNYNEGVASIDATNITITWTKTSSPTGTYQILWEAEA